MRTTLFLIFLLGQIGRAYAAEPMRPRVVATTSIVGDVVRVVGGNDLELTTLLGPGMDPHTFEPAPRDAAAIVGAHLLFLNGGGLETFLEPLLSANQESGVKMIDLCADLPLVTRNEDHEDGHEEAEHDHHHSGDQDPRVWLDPRLVSRWTTTIAEALAQQSPALADAYRARAAAYRDQLAELDRWILTEIQSVPAGQRRFVTDHDEFGYFADRYGIEITGALLPNVSTASESSAREMAELEQHIRATGTRVLVIGYGVNPSLAQRVAHDAGLQLITLYTGALGETGGPAAHYLDYMRFNVTTLCKALKAGGP